MFAIVTSALSFPADPAGLVSALEELFADLTRASAEPTMRELSGAA